MNVSRREVLPPALLFLVGFVVLAACLAVPCNAASVGIAASPAKLNMGSLAQGQPAYQEVKVYNPDNGTLSYTAALKGVSGSVSPDRGIIQGKSNQTVSVTVTGAGAPGARSGVLHLESQAGGASKGNAATVLPAIDLGVVYSVTGATYAMPGASGPGELIALVVLAGVAAVCVGYVVKLRLGGKL